MSTRAKSALLAGAVVAGLALAAWAGPESAAPVRVLLRELLRALF